MMEDNVLELETTAKLESLPDVLLERVFRIALSGHYSIKMMVCQRSNIMLVCRRFAEITKNLPLTVNSTARPPPCAMVLKHLPVQHLSLSTNLHDGESLLRSREFIQASSVHLETLRAGISCSDTLLHFPNLIQVGILNSTNSMDTFYPTVLNGVGLKLKTLEIINYPAWKPSDFARLFAHPAASQLDTLRLIPRLGWRENDSDKKETCTLVEIPEVDCLDRFEVETAFHAIAHQRAAPWIVLYPRLFHQVRELSIQAAHITIILSSESMHGDCVVDQLVTELLMASWRSIKLMTIEDCLRVKHGDNVCIVGLNELSSRLDQAGGSQIDSCCTTTTRSIFPIHSLVLRRVCESFGFISSF